MLKQRRVRTGLIQFVEVLEGIECRFYYNIALFTSRNFSNNFSPFDFKILNRDQIYKNDF